ncbi:unnamed protein product, partial [Brassica napus]
SLSFPPPSRRCSFARLSLSVRCFGGFVVRLYVCGRAFLVCSGLSLKVDARVSRHLASWWWSYATEGFFWRLSLHDGFFVCSLGFLVFG